ncbi:MAG: tetratricopeptide repeat protein [Halobacteriota archaeon]
MEENIESVEQESALKSFANELMDRNKNKFSHEDYRSLQEITDGGEQLKKVVELLLSDQALCLLKSLSMIDEDIDYESIQDAFTDFDNLDGVLDELAQAGLLKTEEDTIAFTAPETKKMFSEDKKEYHSLAYNYYSKKAEKSENPVFKVKALQHSVNAGHIDHALSIFSELSRNHGKRADEVTEAGEELLKRVEGINKGEVFKMLGSAYFDSGSLDKAKDRYAQALDIYMDYSRQDEEKYMPELAKILNNLGNACRHRGDNEEAEKHFKYSAKVFTELKMPENLSVTLENLGTLYRDSKRYDEAEHMFKQVIELRKDILRGENIPGVSTAYHNLASVYKLQERVDDAENTYKELIDYLEKNATGEHKSFIYEAKNSLASYYTKLGRTDEALEIVYDIMSDLELIPEVRTGVYITAAKAMEQKGEKENAADLYMKAASLSFILFRTYGIYIANFIHYLEKVEELASGKLRGDATLMRLGILKNYYEGKKMHIGEMECGERGQMILHAIKGKSISKFKVESQEDKAAYIIANDIR